MIPTYFFSGLTGQTGRGNPSCHDWVWINHNLSPGSGYIIPPDKIKEGENPQCLLQSTLSSVFLLIMYPEHLSTSREIDSRAWGNEGD